MPISRRCSLTLTIAAVALVLTACGESIDDEGVSMSFNCNEARGALFRLDQMLTGQAPVAPGDFGGGTLLRLAEEKQAPETIMRDLETWRGALLAHSHSLTSFQPQIANGRFRRAGHVHDRSHADRDGATDRRTARRVGRPGVRASISDSQLRGRLRPLVAHREALLNNGRKQALPHRSGLRGSST